MNKLVKKFPDKIKTKRLLLRAPILSDAPFLQKLADNKKLYQVLARLPHPYSIKDAVEFIQNIARSKKEHSYAIIKENDEFIGLIGISVDGEENLEIGYWLGEPFWGNGYATEAGRALVKEVFATGQKIIYSRAISSNLASINVLKKIGFIIIDERVDDCGRHKGVPVTYLKCENVDENI